MNHMRKQFFIQGYASGALLDRVLLVARHSEMYVQKNIFCQICFFIRQENLLEHQPAIKLHIN